MPSPQDFLRKLNVFLKGTPAFMSFPISLLLIAVEKMIEMDFFSCPCIVEVNAPLTTSIFIGPAFFTFTLMFLVVRPFKNKCSRCCGGSSDDTQQNCPKAFGSCLIPPIVWISILLFQGDYVACAMTDWEGVYVFDTELNRSWCKPTEKTQNETELRDLTRKYIHQSLFSAYVLIAVFSALVIIVVGVYDCCISGKCECCPSHLLSCWRRTEEEQSVEQDNAGTDSVRLGALHGTTQNQTVRV